jgi:hypothetical protein
MKEGNVRREYNLKLNWNEGKEGKEGKEIRKEKNERWLYRKENA